MTWIIAVKLNTNNRASYKHITSTLHFPLTCICVNWVSSLPSLPGCLKWKICISLQTYMNLCQQHIHNSSPSNQANTTNLRQKCNFINITFKSRTYWGKVTHNCQIYAPLFPPLGKVWGRVHGHWGQCRDRDSYSPLPEVWSSPRVIYNKNCVSKNNWKLAMITLATVRITVL